MPRIRTVKPEFWTDEKVGRLKREVRLLYIGLWNLSDDQGVLKNNSNYIKGQLFSYDEDLRVNTVNDWLASLVKARMLVPFEYQNESYYLIRTFDEHQLINRPSKPKFSEEFLLNVKNTHGVLSEYSLQERKGEEGKGKEQGGDFDKNFTKNLDLKNNSPGPQITMPFGEEFKYLWTHWKLYKKTEFKFSYKSPQSEQSSLEELLNLSGGKEEIAAAIIKQSMAKGWKGFFELKNSDNGKNGTAAKKVTGAELDQVFAKRYSQG